MLTKLETWFYQNLHWLRRLVQLFSLLLILAIPLLNRWGWHELQGTFYSMQIGGLEIVDPALALQTILLTKTVGFSLLLMAAIPLIVALLLGKVFCSWMCPFNFLAELGRILRTKMSSRKNEIGQYNPNPRHYWMVLSVLLLFSLFLATPLLTLLSMPGQISGLLGDLIFAGMLGIEWLLVLVLLLLEIFLSRRIWCRMICPVGAVLAIPRARYQMRVKYTPSHCSCSPGHRPCVEACPLYLNPRQPGIYPFCYNCGDCVDACRSEGCALLFKTDIRPIGQISDKSARQLD
ncbi:MAG: hypothetical protein Kow0037_21500 [Calditrichia bacterium]